MLFIIKFKNFKSYIKRIFLGIIIGASMMIPGFSGGTAAMILGIFYDIMNAFISIPKKPKQSVKFLLPYFIGAILGVFIVCFPLDFLIKEHKIYFSYFIMGIIIGSIKCFLPKNNFKIKDLLWTVFGIIPVILQYFLKYNAINLSKNYVFLSIVGVISAVALILPGISFTNILISFGCYEKIISSVINFDFAVLSLFVVSVILGVFLCVKIIIKIYLQYTKTINLVLLGMIIASIAEIYSGFPIKNQLLPCILLFVSGILISFLFGSFDKSTN